jgi:hypothetical protein
MLGVANAFQPLRGRERLVKTLAVLGRIQRIGRAVDEEGGTT